MYDGARRALTMRLRRYVSLSTVLALALLGANAAVGQALRDGRLAPEISGERWINSDPLTTSGLRGHVILVEFWTYG